MSHADNSGRPGGVTPSPAGAARPSSGAATEIERDAAAAKRSVGEAVEEAKDKAGELGKQAKQAAHDAADNAKDQARSFGEDRKDEVASRVDGMANALRGAAGSLDDQDQPAVAGYVRQAASGLDQVSDALSRRSVDDLVETVEDFARRQPVAFLGGAVLAGFVLARFAKSSSDRRYAEARERRYSQASRSATEQGASDHVYNPVGMAPENPTRHRDVDTTIQETR